MWGGGVPASKSKRPSLTADGRLGHAPNPSGPAGGTFTAPCLMVREGGTASTPSTPAWHWQHPCICIWKLGPWGKGGSHRHALLLSLAVPRPNHLVLASSPLHCLIPRCVGVAAARTCVEAPRAQGRRPRWPTEPWYAVALPARHERDHRPCLPAPAPVGGFGRPRARRWRQVCTLSGTVLIPEAAYMQLKPSLLVVMHRRCRCVLLARCQTPAQPGPPTGRPSCRHRCHCFAARSMATPRRPPAPNHLRVLPPALLRYCQ